MVRLFDTHCRTWVKCFSASPPHGHHPKVWPTLLQDGSQPSGDPPPTSENAHTTWQTTQTTWHWAWSLTNQQQVDL